MIILGIETSCDETSAAVLEQRKDRVNILSNIIASSASLQTKFGGIIPEQAAREQLKATIPVIEEALEKAGLKHQDLDAIAVTEGPGLIGSLLVGVETAKVLSLIWNKPLVPINHLIGHFYANWVLHDQCGRVSSGDPGSCSEKQVASSESPQFPAIGLLVSGGHTDLVLFKDHGQYQYLGGTRDDAAGECFDKCARLLGYPYPGGPKISQIGKKGDPKAFTLPRPMLDSKDFDFSFSGLKTSFANLVSQNFKVQSLGEREALNYLEKSQVAHWKRISDQDRKLKSKEKLLADMCASLEQAIVDTLVTKTIRAVQKYKVEHLIVAGGVAANQQLKEELRAKCEHLKINLHIPPPILCTDNAAMIASAAFFNKKKVDHLKLQANPNLSLSN